MEKIEDLFNEPVANRTELARCIGRAGFHDCAEIGVLEGGYSERMAQNIPGINLICVDTWEPSRNHRSARWMHVHFRTARRRLKDYNVRFMKMPSLEAAALVPDQSRDFVYIDALHDAKSVMEDITAWEPKVRPGGVVAGHDWTHRGVTAAVESYVMLHNIAPLYTTLSCEEDVNPSWYWIRKNG
jgi:predicted O-methyltransferase YrrM